MAANQRTIDLTDRNLGGFEILGEAPRDPKLGRMWRYRHACGGEGIIAQSEFHRTPRWCPACKPAKARDRTTFAGRYQSYKKEAAR